MTVVSSRVLSTVSAPYGANLSACELTACISDLGAMGKAVGPTFAFYTEVTPELQVAFIEEMGVDMTATKAVAAYFASKVPYPIHLAA